MTTTTTGPSPSAPPGPRFVVLADDLTSAAEAAGHLADTGRTATVVLDPDAPSATDGGRWPCVDLDSRHLPRGEAALRHQRATGRLLARARGGDGPVGPVGIYKTMDSSLRGNWPAELVGVMRASGRTVAVVAPACPAYDRRTVRGHQYADGVPVHHGPAGRDPVRPVTDSSVLAPLAGEGMRVIPVAPTRDDLAAALSSALAQPPAAAGEVAPLRALVVDATTGEDLDRIAAAVVGHAADVVLCGSPGLWEAVVPFDPLGPDRSPVRAPVTAPVTGSRGRALVLVGSRHPTTRAQLARLREDGVPVFATTDFAGHADPADHLTHLLETQTAVALTTPEALEEDPAAAARQLRELAALGAACARALPGLGLLLTGGDTARAVCGALGGSAIHTVGTVAPGIPLGTLSGARPHPVISKAGGFGDPESLIAAVAALTRRTA
ncbi:four-carbon acid sugar kinase family protein [Streptomyces sp. ME19-01-6]|uniref:four-carbon acid sugar kinase family protein n=1 Tax=Streptomyces sp. ME19-01-6 TaxID=3028686 RepID=UPI0029BD28D3|nr:four-carbon acid sugar kinase family protein [Streptomyces sp. ME19-01-6]MDX3229007.1 four-carbon acid sugar kinase family protein [Streptomyces sp. ME19-01-6]